MTRVLYDLSLHMGYIYDTPASGARHIMRLMPLSLPDPPAADCRLDQGLADA